jgi:hypothetical protein
MEAREFDDEIRKKEVEPMQFVERMKRNAKEPVKKHLTWWERFKQFIKV